MTIFTSGVRRALLEAGFAPEGLDPNSYFAQLSKRDFKVTPEELKLHIDFVTEYSPLISKLSRLMDHLHTGGGDRWTIEERKTLLSAVRILKSSLIPRPLFKVIEKEKQPFLVPKSSK